VNGIGFVDQEFKSIVMGPIF